MSTDDAISFACVRVFGGRRFGSAAVRFLLVIVHPRGAEVVIAIITASKPLSSIAATQRRRLMLVAQFSLRARASREHQRR